jgi:large subunit ribosomal protein L9
MKVILLENVETVGHAGDITEVKDGYFRNFLAPRKLAVLASEGGLRFLAAKRKQASVRFAKDKEKAEAAWAAIEKLACVIVARVGDDGRLYGSVTVKDIQEWLSEKGLNLERKRIEFSPARAVGEYQAKLKLHAEVEPSLKVTVKSS